MAIISENTLMKLKQAAIKSSENSYSPYSHFAVGASVLGGSGEIYSGCNIENASYGDTICAERVAVFNAVSQGENEIKAVAIYTNTGSMTAPCGACRQVIHEFSKEADVYIFNQNNQMKSFKLDELLPFSFGPNDLL